MKKSSKKIVSVVIISIMIITHISFAANKAELNNSLNETNEQIKNTKNEISEVNTQMSAEMKEVNNLIQQISSYETEIAQLNNQIDETNKSITENEEKLKNTEKELEEKQKLLDQRLVALYEAGSTTYLDVLLSSQGITDFISNYYLIEELTENDTELIKSIEVKKQEIEETKKQLETSKTELESTKEKQVAKQNALAVVKADKETKVANLSAEEKELEQTLSEYESDKQRINGELAKIAAAEEAARKAAAASSASFGGNSSAIISSTPSSSGYIFPVAGLSKANIANKNYPSYPGHTGVDVNINVTGKSIVAVKSGTVVTSTALRNSSGGYRSYGEYIVINHHDGTMTLYAHMLSGSRRVQTGETVSQGQVIGTVGSTGNSTGNHLHFEVRVGGYPVNPLPYLP